MTLPSPELLTQIERYILNRPNKQHEAKKSVHYCLFLLCSKSGLRVSEAISFDLANRNEQSLYKITPTKRQKERYVYVSPQVINELKKNNWKPNQTNRFNFYYFLKRIKQELNIPPQVELTPHTLRRCFATYQAQAGMPLPLLSKMLGHKSIRTTALYWMNVYSEPEQSIKPPQDDMADILLGKEWLEKHENKQPPQPEPVIIGESEPVLAVEPPRQTTNTAPNIAENFRVNEPDPPVVQPSVNKSSVEKAPQTEPKPEAKPAEISPQILVEKVSEQQLEVSQPLTILLNEPNQEQVLLKKIQQLEEKLKQVQTENKNLKAEKYQAKDRANYYENQLKSIAKSLYQWQKLNHYQQLEQEQKAEQKCRIVQIDRPPPFRSGKSIDNDW